MSPSGAEGGGALEEDTTVRTADLIAGLGGFRINRSFLRVSRVAQEPRGALDIGENERHDARRQIVQPRSVA
jgi:hypothetical protein